MTQQGVRWEPIAQRHRIDGNRGHTGLYCKFPDRLQI